MKLRNTLLIGAVLLLFVAGTASAAVMQNGTSGVQGITASSSATLYDQTGNESGNGAPDQVFEASYAAYTAEGADDFEVTDAPGWDVNGYTSAGSSDGPSAFINVTFYADNGGVPADTAVSGCEFLGVTDYTDTDGAIAANLPTCNLAPGFYWIAQSVRQDFGSSGQHFFGNRSVLTNSAGVWRNPADGFGLGCVDWTPQTVCGVGGGSSPDYSFTILGDVRSAGDGTGGGVPAVGPFGMLMMVMALGGGSGYVLARRRRS